MLFLTWGTVMPAILALGLMVAQLFASRFLFPEAGEPPDGLTVERLLHLWIALPIVVPIGVTMVVFDIVTLVLVGTIDREWIATQFDQAEYWLGSRTAQVVKVFTLGYVNPRKMVTEEVRKALVEVGGMINTNLWWLNIQVGLRFAFGLALWVTWAVGHSMG
jgi:hypothetical protein